ncbi:DUF6712 family protein [Dyadobacter crusticola]|uniref:DUF6712 family protein n=1 Tax=Dyadobacter crusticola TaxID=292407 RepID=UPI0004E28164|nr:DUF6712 family protein [Dyadobacter crusticola]
MSLITKIEQVRAVIGSAVRKDNSFEILKPYLDKAENQLLAGLIGSDQLAALEAEQQGKAGELKILVENAIVWNGYQDAWYQASYEFGGSGIGKTKSEKFESLFRYQEDAVQKDIVRKADEAIEALMMFLEANLADFPLYKDSDEFSQNYGYLISTPAALERALPEVPKSYRMYSVLRRFMYRVELKTVKTVTGEALYNSLKAMVRSGQALDANHKALLELCQEFAAPAVLLNALPWISVQISPAGIRIASVFNNLQDEKAVSDPQIAWLTGILEKQVEQAKTSLRMYLNGTASSTVFPQYYASGLYRTNDSKKWTLPDNAGRKHFRF